MHSPRRLSKVAQLSILLTIIVLVFLFYWGIKYQGFSKSTTAKQDTPQFLGTLTYVNQIVGYWESSTSRYLTPELNKVTGPIQTTIGDNATDSQSALAYKYEIAWRNDPKYSEGGSGIDVWLFIPITVDWQSDPERLEWFNEEEYVFLWLQYDKKDEKHLLPILNTFALYPKSSYGQ